MNRHLVPGDEGAQPQDDAQPQGAAQSQDAVQPQGAGQVPAPTRWWLTFDAILVMVFVVVGRDTHQESATLVDIAETAAPFLWALLAGWGATRAWLHPISWKTGLGVSAVTIGGGMLLRRFVYSDGIATAFIVVTSIFFLGTFLGWRALARPIVARRRRRRSRRPLADTEQG